MLNDVFFPPDIDIFLSVSLTRLSFDVAISTFGSLLTGAQVLRGRALAARRVALAADLFALFNRCAFGGLLPTSTPISWNARLTKTAGFTSYKLNRVSGERTCAIELSTKVVDDSDRLQWTVMHEMCHAAQVLCIYVYHAPLTALE